MEETHYTPRLKRRDGDPHRAKKLQHMWLKSTHPIFFDKKKQITYTYIEGKPYRTACQLYSSPRGALQIMYYADMSRPIDPVSHEPVESKICSIGSLRFH